jgi:hypothetical protein
MGFPRLARPDPDGRWLGYGWALAVGVVFVLSVFPHDLLRLGAVPDARLSGDVAQHVVGQRAFLQDSWHWPLLRTTMLDAPGGLSVAMTDANPLVALPLKLVGGWLPAGFSAVQLWLAFCYLAQPVAAVFALRSAGERRLVPAVAVSLFAIAMPSFLFRHPHSALSSHFVLLLALGAYWRGVRGAAGGRWLPPVLQLASFLIHPYLAAMVAAVLLAVPATLALRWDRRWARACLPVLGGFALTAAAAACLGYGAATPSGGFGEASMNALSPVFPAQSYYFGHGLSVLDATGSQHEGYQFLGPGLLALLGFAGVACLFSTRVRFLRRHFGLALACVALTALALSGVVYVGTHKVLDLGRVPAVLHQLRASGRLFWPVAYVLLVGAVAAVARVAPRPLAWAVLLGTAMLQLLDARGERKIVTRDLRAVDAPAYDAARLDGLLRAHSRLTVLPTFGCGANAATPEFLQLMLAASRLRVAVNTMYVARFAAIPDCAVTEAATAPLAEGELRLFLPMEAAAGPAEVPDGARLCRAFGATSVCTRQVALLDGLAPVRPAEVAPGREVAVGVAEAGAAPGVLGTGWYAPEPSGVWSVEHAAVLAARLSPALPAGAPVAFEALMQGFSGVHGVAQHVALSVNGHLVVEQDVRDREDTVFRAQVPVEDLVEGAQVLRFDIAHPVRPSEVGIITDSRQLGVFLKSVRLGGP